MPAPSLRVAVAAVVAQTVFMAVAFALVFGVFADDDPFDGSAGDFVRIAAIHLVDAGLVVGLLLMTWGRARLADLGWGPAIDQEATGRGPDPGRRSLPRLAIRRFLGRESRDPTTLWVPIDGRAIGLGVVGALSCAALVAAATGTTAFPEMTGSQRLLCALIGVGAGFVEESVFRGALQPALARRLGGPLAVVVTAVVFSAYHLKFAPIGFVVKVLFGGVFGTLRQVTGTCWAPAIAHAGVWVLVGFA